MKSSGSTPEEISTPAGSFDPGHSLAEEPLLLTSGVTGQVSASLPSRGGRVRVGVFKENRALREDRIASPLPRHRSLSRVLDDAFQRFYHSPFEEWLGGLFGRLRR